MITFRHVTNTCMGPENLKAARFTFVYSTAHITLQTGNTWLNFTLIPKEDLAKYNTLLYTELQTGPDKTRENLDFRYTTCTTYKISSICEKLICTGISKKKKICIGINSETSYVQAVWISSTRMTHTSHLIFSIKWLVEPELWSFIWIHTQKLAASEVFSSLEFQSHKKDGHRPWHRK